MIVPISISRASLAFPIFWDSHWISHRSPLLYSFASSLARRFLSSYQEKMLKTTQRLASKSSKVHKASSGWSNETQVPSLGTFWQTSKNSLIFTSKNSLIFKIQLEASVQDCKLTLCNLLKVKHEESSAMLISNITKTL